MSHVYDPSHQSEIHVKFVYGIVTEAYFQLPFLSLYSVLFHSGSPLTYIAHTLSMVDFSYFFSPFLPQIHSRHKILLKRKVK